jgi:guanine deaminase
MHKQFLQQAIDLASDNVSSQNGGPYGAVIVKNGEIIAASGNCVTLNCDPTAHAEVSAIRLACKKLNDFQLSNCILYSSCEPCPMCLGAIYWTRLKEVYFACNRQDAAKAGFDDSFIYDEILLHAEKRHIPMRQLNIANAGKPFLDWNKQNNKIPY